MGRNRSPALGRGPEGTIVPGHDQREYWLLAPLDKPLQRGVPGDESMAAIRAEHGVCAVDIRFHGRGVESLGLSGEIRCSVRTVRRYQHYLAPLRALRSLR
jgi:hypothetical protein